MSRKNSWFYVNHEHIGDKDLPFAFPTHTTSYRLYKIYKKHNMVFKTRKECCVRCQEMNELFFKTKE